MPSLLTRSALLLSCLLVLAGTSPAAPAVTDHWVGTWASAPMQGPNGRFRAGGPNGPNSPQGPMTPGTPMAPATAGAPGANSASAMPAVPATPAATPAAADNPRSTPSQARPAPFVYGTADTTVREIVHVSIGGPQVRVVFTNEFGTDPLIIGAAQIAISQGGSAINTAGASAAGLTFNGRPGVTIPPGAVMVSDPATVTVPALSDVAVTFFLPTQPIAQLTQHGYADQTGYTAPGNVVGAKSFESPTEIRAWPFLKAVEVKAPAHAGSVVTFGDSITDGAFAAMNMNARWPDELARRLQADKRTADVGVLNVGIGGNRILHDNAGPNALSRFDRDVIAQSGVKYLVVLEAINDIGHAYDPGRAYDVVSADDLIGAYIQMAERAHAHGIKVYFATLTPYVGAKYASPAGEEVRKTLNTWIRTNKIGDGFIDFEKVAADPAHPDSFLPAYDHGDHLHPADAGYKAMGDSIDLALFTR